MKTTINTGSANTAIIAVKSGKGHYRIVDDTDATYGGKELVSVESLYHALDVFDTLTTHYGSAKAITKLMKYKSVSPCITRLGETVKDTVWSIGGHSASSVIDMFEDTEKEMLREGWSLYKYAFVFENDKWKMFVRDDDPDTKVRYQRYLRIVKRLDNVGAALVLALTIGSIFLMAWGLWDITLSVLQLFQ